MTPNTQRKPVRKGREELERQIQKQIRQDHAAVQPALSEAGHSASPTKKLGINLPSREAI